MRRELRHERGLENLRARVRSRLRRQAADLAHDQTHLDRVWRNVRQLAAHEEARLGLELDGDLLEAATLLHDVGRGAEQTRETTSEASARIAEELLRLEGLPDLVWPVCEMVLSHGHGDDREPSSAEAKVLADADALDALGAIGIARAFLTGAANGIPGLYHPTDPGASDRPLDENAWVIDGFPAKLLHLAERMHTESGRAEAARRTRVMRGFYEALVRDAVVAG
jgi:uncharacterized protein